MIVWLALLGAVHAQSPMPVPIAGWSTWNTFECNINATLIQESIHALAASPLFHAGYNYVLIDDCWTTCDKLNADGTCATAGRRDSAGRIVIDSKKFPEGFKPLTSLAHSLGIKMGIYTSVGTRTCAGFVGSYDYERTDARSFVEWGFDFVKHDTCDTNYNVHDGGLQNASRRMAEGLWTAGKGKVIYYIDSGNPTSPQRVFNPRQRHVTDKEALQKLAVKPAELVWVWATSFGDDKGPHFFKSWFDIEDTWGSTLTNVHNQVRLAEYQTCGHLNTPDMLTAGMGKQTQGEYRAQFFLWSMLGAPLIMGNDIRKLDNFTSSLVTSPEVLAVDRDPDCVQASQARALGSTETWIKPLHDGSFAVVLLNKGEAATDITVFMNDAGQGWGAGEDFFPAVFDKMTVRDLYYRKNLGEFQSTFKHKVDPHDAAIFKMTPV